MTKSATLKIQQWGNSLALRIPSVIARSARLTVGQPVEILLQENAVLFRPVGEPKLTLAQKLAIFDPEAHGGEVMAARPVGKEVL